MQIVFYRDKHGEEPVRDFLNSLCPKMRAIVLRTIKLLADNGYKLREPYTKPLQNGIFELRIKVGSEITRILFFFVIGNKAVLTHGFIKKSERTPSSEIERAIRYREEYLGNKEC